MRAVVLTQPGPPENLKIDTVPIPSKKKHEVLIRVKASALNRADTSQRRGFYPPPPGASDIIGMEVAGTIEAEEDLDSNEGIDTVQKRWKKGDRVMALISGGGYAEFVNVNAKHVLPIPDILSFEQAAAIPEVWLTSFQILHLIADVKRGEHVLIHAAASGVGTAAIQLTLGFGAHPIAVVSSADKIDYVLKLGATAAINYKEQDFAKAVHDSTHQAGVEIIMDPVGASNFEKNLSSIREDGRWVLFGALGGTTTPGSVNLGVFMKKRIRLEGTTLRSRSDEYKARLVKSFEEHAIRRFVSGEYKPIIHCVLPFAKISEAHELMESNTTIGKVVMTW